MPLYVHQDRYYSITKTKSNSYDQFDDDHYNPQIEIPTECKPAKGSASAGEDADAWWCKAIVDMQDGENVNIVIFDLVPVDLYILLIIALICRTHLSSISLSNVSVCAADLGSRRGTCMSHEPKCASIHLAPFSYLTLYCSTFNKSSDPKRRTYQIIYLVQGTLRFPVI